MDADLLRYSDTLQIICTKNFTRRQLHDLERYVCAYPSKIQVCSCLSNPWARSTLSFLGAQWIPRTEQCSSTRST